MKLAQVPGDLQIFYLESDCKGHQFYLYDFTQADNRHRARLEYALGTKDQLRPFCGFARNKFADNGFDRPQQHPILLSEVGFVIPLCLDRARALLEARTRSL